MPPNRGKRKHPGGGGGRGRGAGRGKDAGRGKKGGKGEPKPTREEVKDLFKQRKYNKNNYPMQQEEESSSEEEEEETPGEYDQLLSAFGGSEGGKAVDSESESSDDDDSDVDGQMDDASENNVEDDQEIVSDNIDDDESDNELVKEGGDSSSEEDNVNDDNDGVLEEDDDEVAEESGNENEEAEEQDQCSDDEQDDTSDPFTAHFETELHESAVKKLKAGKCWTSSVIDWPELGSLQVQNLDWTAPKTLLPPDKATVVQRKLISSFPSSDSSIETLHIKEKLLNNFPKISSSVTPLQSELMPLICGYKDLQWNGRTHKNGEETRAVYTLHALNHILKTRNKIVGNNTKIEKGEDNEDGLRDQGLCRPKVLIVVPFKESLRRIVEMMIKLLGLEEKGGVFNRKRFYDDFPAFDIDRKDKSDDFYDTFSGDIGDSFKLGIAVTKKTLKLYSDFYSSDIIIASPLGLRLVLGVEGESDRDSDFLASIEVLILDQTDIFLMQNWDHVTTAISSLHQQPKESHGVDFGRVRMWGLDGLSSFYRQTIVISSTPTPEITGLFSRSCTNYFGKVRVSNPVENGAICGVLCETPVVFHRVDSKSIAGSLEDRLKYFTNKIMPQFKRDEMDHTLIFVPSYFDFVKVRNWFKMSDLDYSELSEYTKDKKIAQARDLFFHNEKHFLIYTERCHFYKRFRLKGIRHLIFYQLPQYSSFMGDLCNLLQSQFQNRRGGSDTNMSITVLYNKYDAVRLAAVVSSDTAATMLQAENNVHKFETGKD